MPFQSNFCAIAIASSSETLLKKRPNIALGPSGIVFMTKTRRRQRHHLKAVNRRALASPDGDVEAVASRRRVVAKDDGGTETSVVARVAAVKAVNTRSPFPSSSVLVGLSPVQPGRSIRKGMKR
jgi:hypothetical protein